MTNAVNIAQTGTISSSWRNRIINGDLDIWQRGTTATGAYVYGADRWATGPFTSAQTISRSTSVPSGAVAQYSLSLQRPAASTSTTTTIVMQTIETANCYDLAGQQVTISFWAKAGANFSAASSNLNVQVATGTAADQGGVSYYTWTGFSGFTNTQPITTTWTKYSFTGTLGSGVLEVAVLFYFVPTGTAGADDAVYITGVQLEKGSAASPFDYRPYGTELMLCQRYFQLAGQGFTGCAEGTTAITINEKYMVVMRAGPSSAVVSGQSCNIRFAGGDTNNSAPTLIAPSTNTNAIWTLVGGFSGLTSGASIQARNNSVSTLFIALSAEL